MPDILSDKRYKEYARLSRYANTPYYYNSIEDKYVSGTCRGITKNTPYKIHKVTVGDTLDSLALYYYNNPTYYWIIADFNDILNPFDALEVNSRLRIPTFSSIEFAE